MARSFRLILVAFLVACGSNVFFVRTNTKVFPPRDEKAVIRVFLTELPKRADYVEIGVIVSRGDNIESRVARAKEKARLVGADALISLKEDYRSSTYISHQLRTGVLTESTGKTFHYVETVPVQERYEYVEQRFIAARLNIQLPKP